MDLPPPDLTLPLSELSRRHQVPKTIARQWKLDAGVLLKRGRSGVRPDSLARLVTHEEWSKGCRHVGRLPSISPQAAWMVRNRLIDEGHNLPMLRRGRGGQLKDAR